MCDRADKVQTEEVILKNVVGGLKSVVGAGSIELRLDFHIIEFIMN